MEDASLAAPVSAPQQISDEPNRLAELFYQLQLLQQEVQELRGLAEEQAYHLERLAKDQKEQYLDLDARMRELATAAPATLTANPDTQTVPGLPTAMGSERDAYTAAFNLMKGRQFDASKEAFRAILAQYPAGDYSPNVYYWLGELYLAGNELEEARQSFMQVVTSFPTHQKVADALYKLGVTQHRLGFSGRALEFLNRVQAEFPNSSAAGLASTYAAELQ